MYGQNDFICLITFLPRAAGPVGAFIVLLVGSIVGVIAGEFVGNALESYYMSNSDSYSTQQKMIKNA